MTLVHRCSICNKTNSEAITEEEDYFPGPYLPDPKQPSMFICLPCAEWHIQLMSDYYLDDEERNDNNALQD